jgi:hypothetical protein
LRKLTRDRENSGISRLAIGTRVQGSFLIRTLGVGRFGFVQSVGHPAFIGIKNVSSTNAKLHASLREAFMKFTRFIELNPQYPYIPLVIRGHDQSKGCRQNIKRRRALEMFAKWLAAVSR